MSMFTNRPSQRRRNTERPDRAEKQEKQASPQSPEAQMLSDQF